MDSVETAAHAGGGVRTLASTRHERELFQRLVPGGKVRRRDPATARLELLGGTTARARKPEPSGVPRPVDAIQLGNKPTGRATRYMSMEMI
nr:hypothetical protein CFP56_53677 [Quercus suber]